MSPVLVLSILFLSLCGPIRAQDRALPEYEVDLDLPPEERWIHIVKDYSSFIQNAKKLATYMRVKANDEFINKVIDGLPEQNRRELIGIVNATTDLSLQDLVVIHMMMDIMGVRFRVRTAEDDAKEGVGGGGMCTAVVADDVSSGVPIMVKNFDIYYGKVLSREAAIIVHAKKNGKHVFSVVTFPSFVGVFDGVRHGAFAITHNQRAKSSFQDIFAAALENNFEGMKSIVFRKVLEEVPTFDEAVHTLVRNKAWSPGYLTLSGSRAGQGVIITKSLNKHDRKIQFLNQSSNGYLAQTNYDHWNGGEDFDGRYNATINGMTKLLPHITAEKVFDVLSRPDVKVDRPSGGTLFTTIMSAKNPEKIKGTKIRASEFADSEEEERPPGQVMGVFQAASAAVGEMDERGWNSTFVK